MFRSLDGLSVGDGLGQRFFVGRGNPEPLVAERSLPPGPWTWSDDTVMAVSIVEGLLASGRVDQEELARAFGRRFLADTERGYGPMAYWLLHQLGAGAPWRETSAGVFSGQGSLGNGSAMRVAPLGAFFSADLDHVVAEARASSEITHMHPDGIAGAVAVALTTALLVQASSVGTAADPEQILQAVIERTPAGETLDGIRRALTCLGQPAAEAAAVLGDGRLVRCSDTVPFSLWCSLSEPIDYERAVWLALEGLLEPESDRDTVLAIVGGVVGACAPAPAEWLALREPLPAFER